MVGWVSDVFPAAPWERFPNDPAWLSGRVSRRSVTANIRMTNALLRSVTANIRMTNALLRSVTANIRMTNALLRSVTASIRVMNAHIQIKEKLSIFSEKLCRPGERLSSFIVSKRRARRYPQVCRNPSFRHSLPE
jgi:hypothetical protein